MKAVTSTDKLKLYELSVQNPEFEVAFMRRVYTRLRGKAPKRFREDFCGTALIACEWVRRVKDGLALGVDLHGPTLKWGREHNVATLGKRAPRVRLVRRNVLDPCDFRPDVVAAYNFSYFVFKSRPALREYFAAVHESLASDGVFSLDIYGGPDAQKEVEEERDCDGFTYVWHQARYNPITGETLCHIHFDLAKGKRIKKAFTYDWRLWSLPEVKDVLAEVGFKKIDVYWEGTDKKTGGGNDVFRVSRRGDDSVSWIAYIVAAK